MQLKLDLSLPTKSTRKKLSPEMKEKAEAHRSFKLLKSNRFRNFSEEQLRLLEKYYGIRL